MQDTRLVRIPIDLAVMVAAIVKDSPSNTSELLDSFIRRPVERLFDKLPAADREYALARIARLTGEPEAAATASAK